MKMTAGILFLAICALAAPAANAQQMTWTDQGFVNVNIGAQTGSHDLATTSTFEKYEEQATLATAQSVGGGGLFDIGAGYKVWRNLAVGLSYSRSKSDADVAIAANIPDPVFFDRPRAITAAASGLDHTESAIHLQGTWVMPFTDKMDFALSFGPTIFMVKQELPSAIEVTEPGPTVTSTTFITEDKTTVGINLGVDVNYMFTPRYGAGLLARYAWGSVDLSGVTESLSVGGFQIGVGFRYRFGKL
jgi:outer membrane protein with beta-barrel domain